MPAQDSRCRLRRRFGATLSRGSRHLVFCASSQCSSPSCQLLNSSFVPLTKQLLRGTSIRYGRFGQEFVWNGMPLMDRSLVPGAPLPRLAPACGRSRELGFWLFAQTTHVKLQLPNLFIGFDLCEAWHAAQPDVVL